MQTAMAIYSGRDMSVLQLISLLSILFGAAVNGSTINTSPSDSTVLNGTLASFDCSISCSHSLVWYVGAYPLVVRSFTEVTLAGFVEKTGIHVQLENTMNECPGNSGSSYAQRIQVLATIDLNRTAVQCAAFPKNSGDQLFFSRYAVLLVENDPVDGIPTPSPCPIPSPSPCPTETVTHTERHTEVSTTTVPVCAVTRMPLPDTVTHTVTHTVVSTTTASLCTVPPPETVTVTHTKVVVPTSTPNCPDANQIQSGSVRLHLHLLFLLLIAALTVLL